jgi:hypothetical protein
MQEFLHNSAIVSVYAPIVAGAHRVEAKLSGLKIADFGVDGKVDLVGHSDTGVDIVDWKMGQADTFDDSLQLFAYGLWASREFNEPSERIRARKVYLGGPTVGEMTVLDDGLMRRGKARMVQDIELMKDLDRYGREGNEEAFTPCERPNMCRQCSFRGTCSAGLPLTKSRPTFAWSPAPQLVD